MVDFDQGPGRNIEFCLITTGIDIDPDHGCIARDYYAWLKNVIEQRADIHYENREIREIFDQDAHEFLKAYTDNPRTIYQFLFGLVEHSNAWTEDELIESINETPFPRALDPKDGEYSIDFYQSKEDGMTLYENQFISATNVWVEKQTFYVSGCKPLMLDGKDGDVWFVTDEFDIEVWIKSAFKWMRLDDHVKRLDPAGTTTYSITDPGNSTNSWWFDLTGLNIRKYSVSLNTWESFTSVTVSPSQPGGLSDGELWVKVIGGKFSVFVFDGLTSTFKQVKVSKFIVQDRATNSAFKFIENEVIENNFIIDCGEEALNGGPINGGAGNLKVKKNNILIQTAVDCINIVGPDLDVTAGGPGEVTIEHLPFTTLPEQSSPPSPLADNGRIFTLDIGGITEFFYRDDSGNVIQITNDGITVQNVYLAISTLSAVPGQTVFAIPPSAKAVLTVKVNGVDTTAWTFSAPSVTYDPIGGGYVIQSGDVLTVLYYGS